MKEDAKRYAARGVSAGKSEVHAAVSHLGKGLYPGAFCKMWPDIFDNDEERCYVVHTDSAGTKTSLAYLAWKMGVISIQQAAKVVIDSLIMNIDDIGCVGCFGRYLITMDCNRNKFLIPPDMVAALINECDWMCSILTQLGVTSYLASGETADVPDLVRTLTVGHAVFSKMWRKDVIDASKMQPADIIIGFSNTGRTPWEDKPNSSMGSNGLTNARHDSLCSDYRKYTETYSPEMPPELVYCGKSHLSDSLPGDTQFTIAEALLSPTRTYVPMLKELLAIIPRKHIHGLIHCSGGGQTKIGKFGANTNRYVKDNLFPKPPLFAFIQEASGTPEREMYATFNMGHRMEAVVDPSIATQCIEISQSYGIEAQIIGYVESDNELVVPEVRIEIDGHEPFHYFPQEK